MKTIGLTGGIASGKSTVASILQKLGAHIFDADIASRQAVARGSQGLQQVVDVEASPGVGGGILFLSVAQHVRFPVGQPL